MKKGSVLLIGLLKTKEFYGFDAEGRGGANLGRPEELSTLALFMVSPRASLVHGACWSIDGGQSRSNI